MSLTAGYGSGGVLKSRSRNTGDKIAQKHDTLRNQIETFILFYTSESCVTNAQQKTTIEISVLHFFVYSFTILFLRPPWIKPGS